jgi:hypothetical protein
MNFTQFLNKNTKRFPMKPAIGFKKTKNGKNLIGKIFEEWFSKQPML